MLEKLPHTCEVGRSAYLPIFKGVSAKAKPAKAIDYITDERKAAYVSSLALDDSYDYAKQFTQTAQLFGKGERFSERKYYHFKLSPDPADRASPAQVHKLADGICYRGCLKSSTTKTHDNRPSVAIRAKLSRCIAAERALAAFSESGFGGGLASNKLCEGCVIFRLRKHYAVTAPCLPKYN